jgi:UDP-hydrolysing UDP-N-acetyl-D-glucosamine 2-epimerase
MPRKARPRRVCFVTGTRAEFGLMASTLAAIRGHAGLELQLVVTGQHTQASRGRTIGEIRRAGWTIDATVPWPEAATPGATARATGAAMARLAKVYETLAPEVVLVVGDRVEAFAAASAAHIGGHVVAHVHGGDRALGQVDDALRHAISKLAHLHFAATPASGARLFAMGEDRWRVRVVGAPGIDGIRTDAGDSRAFLGSLGVDASDFVLLLLHPTEASEAAEARRTRRLIAETRRAFGGPIVALLPNNDPGAEGIARALRSSREGKLVTHAERPAFLGLLRDCRALIGNSSSGIIEAGAFGTPVLDVGPRPTGRERGPNVVHAEDDELPAAIRRVLRQQRTPVRLHPYGGGGAGRRIASVLASVPLDARLRRKLIRY